MSSQARSMPELIQAPPLPGDVICTVRSADDLVEALRTVKMILGLSNGFCDDMIGVAAGHTDKVLGPTRAKGLSPFMLDNYIALFAIQFEMKLDMEAVKRMQARWDRREEGRIHVDDTKVSKKAKQRVLQAFSKQGNAARNAMLPAEHRSRIARKAALARWKKKRNRERSTKPAPIPTPV